MAHHQWHYTSIAISALIWDTGIRWIGAAQILSQLSPAYNTIARIITGLPKWTPIKFLLAEAGLPPLDLLLTQPSQRYGVRIMRSKDDHLCKKQLLRALGKTEPIAQKDAGLQRIANLLKEIIKQEPARENTTHHTLGTREDPEIDPGSKEQGSINHMR